MFGFGTYIGGYSKLPIYVGSRCKFCRKCKTFHQKGIIGPVSQHNCLLNWTESSGSMEPSIAAVEGVKELQTKNMTLGILVGDGDCKIDSHLQSDLPVGSLEYVRNFDTNHVIKNFTTHLYELNKQWKGTGKFSQGVIKVES